MAYTRWGNTAAARVLQSTERRGRDQNLCLPTDHRWKRVRANMKCSVVGVTVSCRSNTIV